MLYNKTKYSTLFLNPTIPLYFYCVYIIIDSLSFISINNHVISQRVKVKFIKKLYSLSF